MISGDLLVTLRGTESDSEGTLCAPHGYPDGPTFAAMGLGLHNNKPPITLFILDDDGDGPMKPSAIASIGTGAAVKEYVWDGRDPLMGPGAVKWVAEAVLSIDITLVEVDSGSPLRFLGTLGCAPG